MKWARRRPAAAALLAVAVVAVAASAGLAARQSAAARQRERTESARVAVLGEAVSHSLFEGQSLLAAGKWGDARLVLTNVMTRLRNEPRLDALLARAAGLLDRADRGDAARQQAEGVRLRYRKFLALRDQALFHETQFTGLDTAGNHDMTRREARAALAVFDAPGPRPEGLSDAEWSAVRDGSYELLLVLADAEQSPARGLEALDHAARLVPAPTRAYHLRRAACLSRQGDRPGASRERAEAERLPPATAFDHFLAGQERMKRRDYPKALRHLDAALRLQPDHFWAHALAAVVELQVGRPSVARAELNACLQREPGFAWLYVLRGFASAQIAASVREASRPPGERGNQPRDDLEGQFAAASDDDRKAQDLLRDRPDDEILYAVLVNRGLLEYQRGRYDAAAAALAEAVRLNGRQYQALSSLGQVLKKQGRFDEAVGQFDRALAWRPDWSPLYRGRAEVNLARPSPSPSHRADALRDLDLAVRHETPGNPVLASDPTDRARLLHAAGRDDEALAACDAALAVVPDHAAAHLLRINVLLNRRRYDEVLRSCDALLARGEPWAEIYELRGLARAGRRDFAGAIEDDSRALSLRPGSAPLLASRGWVYLVANAPELALHDFEESVRLDPSAPETYYGRGTARVRLGDHRAAVADAEEGLRRSGPSPRSSYNAARVYALASATAAADVARNGRDAVRLTSRYQDRAVALLRDAVGQVKPAASRTAFLRDQILADPALRPIRQRLKSFRLSTSVATAAGPAG